MKVRRSHPASRTAYRACEIAAGPSGTRFEDSAWKARSVGDHQPIQLLEIAGRSQPSSGGQRIPGVGPKPGVRKCRSGHTGRHSPDRCDRVMTFDQG